ncbi:hypothetical protein EJP82_17995 [Paenibacillus anaericanus]|uniref:Uncharacterized protein n=1 Tax=Paenibacillus anaericanus TaxID=170367 RepID=A0A433Y6G6_9BACL|nr:hypothetical protein [Paenibacillus anaericanus]RUT44506.1 hypothetical protein EJP82_17995 [Paenibacillus anaericanus]
MNGMINKGRNNVRGFNFILGIIFLITIVSCSTTTTEPETTGINANNDLLSQFAFEGRIYSIEGNVTPVEKIEKEVGEIKEILDDVKENGQAKLFNTKIDLIEGTKIYSIQDVDKDTVVAVKIKDIYYTAFFLGKLD